MTNPIPAADGRCLASGQAVTPYVIEPEITVICPECAADVPLVQVPNAEPPTYTIASHPIPRPPRRHRGTQLMLEL